MQSDGNFRGPKRRLAERDSGALPPTHPRLLEQLVRVTQALGQLGGRGARGALAEGARHAPRVVPHDLRFPTTHTQRKLWLRDFSNIDRSSLYERFHPLSSLPFHLLLARSSPLPPHPLRSLAGSQCAHPVASYVDGGVLVPMYRVVLLHVRVVVDAVHPGEHHLPTFRFERLAGGVEHVPQGAVVEDTRAVLVGVQHVPVRQPPAQSAQHPPCEM